MNSEIQEVVKEIKQSFRLMMDGAVAKSMRDKGLSYKLNWGVTLPRLRLKADELKTTVDDYDLAIALWKEDVRECKILATMIMPPDKVLPEVIDIWMEQITSQEIAEQAVFNLFQYLPYAPERLIPGWLPTKRSINTVVSTFWLVSLWPNENPMNGVSTSSWIRHWRLCRAITSVSERRQWRPSEGFLNSDWSMSDWRKVH